jgi:hypothetical protein
MKYILAALIALSGTGYVTAEPETKRVCEVQKDSQGKEKEVCKTIKVHKKLESAQKPSEVKPDTKK